MKNCFRSTRKPGNIGLLELLAQYVLQLGVPNLGKSGAGYREYEGKVLRDSRGFEEFFCRVTVIFVKKKKKKKKDGIFLVLTKNRNMEVYEMVLSAT